MGGIDGFLVPDVPHEFVALEGETGVDAVAGAEDVSAVGHAVAEAVADVFDDFVLGAGLKEAAVEVADEANLVAVAAFDFGDVNAALGIEGVECVGVGVDELVKDGHDVAVGVFDDVEAEFAFCGDEGFEVGGNEFGEHVGIEEGAVVEAVVVAQGEPVEPAVLGEALCPGNHAVDAALGLNLGFVHVFVEPYGLLHHIGAVGDGEGGVAVEHEEEFAAGFFADEIDEA